MTSFWLFVHIFQAMTTLLIFNHFRRVFITFHPNSWQRKTSVRLTGVLVGKKTIVLNSVLYCELHCICPLRFSITSVVNFWKSLRQSFSMKKLNTLWKSTTTLDFQTVYCIVYCTVCLCYYQNLYTSSYFVIFILVTSFYVAWTSQAS